MTASVTLWGVGYLIFSFECVLFSSKLPWIFTTVCKKDVCCSCWRTSLIKCWLVDLRVFWHVYSKHSLTHFRPISHIYISRTHSVLDYMTRCLEPTEFCTVLVSPLSTSSSKINYCILDTGFIVICYIDTFRSTKCSNCIENLSVSFTLIRFKVSTKT
jgi:hypothetical protein